MRSAGEEKEHDEEFGFGRARVNSAAVLVMKDAETDNVDAPRDERATCQALGARLVTKDGAVLW